MKSVSFPNSFFSIFVHLYSVLMLNYILLIKKPVYLIEFYSFIFTKFCFPLFSGFHFNGSIKCVQSKAGRGGVKLIFTEGHFNIMAATKGPVVTVRLYKRYHSLTYC